MAAIERIPVYVQLADQVAERITSGAYGPGEMLPSETALIAEFQVSRPTVRAAIGHLRAMGLVESRHGKGSFVRKWDTAPVLTVPRGVRRKGKGFTGDDLSTVEGPTVTRVQLMGAVGELLACEEGEAFSTERLLADPVTGTRAAHRMFIPLETAEKVPQLAESPDASPSDIYAALAEAGHTLAWSETVTARAPLPDERASLGGSDGDPVLITRRVTADEDGRPLILEELRISAAHGQFAFQITPEKTPARRKAGSV
ncbi:GntR family transcriptional regulator [Streptomyces sp. NPDC050421]|uniref:GntR family transcriptional regulator n=1 Tax=Streptomyces sp. NPDC050421 TaxID=3365613 RepID=UPI0037B43EE3